MKILVLNGPNINLLGLREPELYGSRTYADLVEYCERTASECGATAEVRQTNHEGTLVDWIQESRGAFDAIVLHAAALADELQKQGVRLVSGGTDNHMLLADVYSRGRTGAEVQELLDLANITANKNTIPFDTLSVKTTSGMRFGSPAVTTRGMKEPEMRQIGRMIARLIEEGDAAVAEVKAEAVALCEAFPLYPQMN